MSMNLAPHETFDVSMAFVPSSDCSTDPTYFPRLQVPHLNSKVVRRILAARESIFKYDIYLPRNDRDADASPERA
jgi:hypothetical protein